MARLYTKARSRSLEYLIAKNSSLYFIRSPITALI